MKPPILFQLPVLLLLLLSGAIAAGNANPAGECRVQMLAAYFKGLEYLTEHKRLMDLFFEFDAEKYRTSGVGIIEPDRAKGLDSFDRGSASSYLLRFAVKGRKEKIPLIYFPLRGRPSSNKSYFQTWFNSGRPPAGPVPQDFVLLMDSPLERLEESGEPLTSRFSQVLNYRSLTIDNGGTLIFSISATDYEALLDSPAEPETRLFHWIDLAE